MWSFGTGIAATSVGSRVVVKSRVEISFGDGDSGCAVHASCYHRLLEEHQVYAAIGEEGFERLIAAFYRQVPADGILGPMYPAEDLAGAEQRLRDFLVGRFGGPPRYIEARGHPRLRARHLPFTINSAARNRWMELMERALEQAQLPADAAAILRSFFDGMSAFMINRGD
jgi:hemoglobin